MVSQCMALHPEVHEFCEGPPVFQGEVSDIHPAGEQVKSFGAGEFCEFPVALDEGDAGEHLLEIHRGRLPAKFLDHDSTGFVFKVQPHIPLCEIQGKPLPVRGIACRKSAQGCFPSICGRFVVSAGGMDDSDSGVGLSELAGVRGALFCTAVHGECCHRTPCSEEGVSAVQEGGHISGEVIGLGVQPEPLHGTAQAHGDKQEGSTAAHASKFAR